MRLRLAIALRWIGGASRGGCIRRGLGASIFRAIIFPASPPAIIVIAAGRCIGLLGLRCARSLRIGLRRRPGVWLSLLAGGELLDRVAIEEVTAAAAIAIV